MHCRIGQSAEQHRTDRRPGQLEIPRQQDRIDKHHGRQDGSDKENDERKRCTNDYLMRIQPEDVVVEHREFDSRFEDQDDADYRGVIAAIHRAEIELSVGIASPEVNVRQHRKYQEVVQRPNSDLAGSGWNGATKDRAGNMKAEWTVS